MHLKDRLTSTHIGPIQDNPAIKTSGAHQGRVEDVRTVGCCHYNHVGVSVKSVHLDQNLVERLFALVMTAAESCAAMASNSVDLVHEYNAGAVTLGLIK